MGIHLASQDLTKVTQISDGVVRVKVIESLGKNVLGVIATLVQRSVLNYLFKFTFIKFNFINRFISIIFNFQQVVKGYEMAQSGEHLIHDH